MRASVHVLAFRLDHTALLTLERRSVASVMGSRPLRTSLELWDQVPDPDGRCGLARTDLPVLAARVPYSDDPERVHALLRQAVELLPAGGDPLAACRVYSAIVSEYSQISGVLPQAEALDKALALAGTTPSRDRAEALVAAAFHQHHMNAVGPQLHFAERALEGVLSIGAADVVPEARWGVFNALWLLGRCDESLAVIRTAVRDAEQAEQSGGALELASELAFYLLLLGRIDEGLTLARRTRSAAEQAGLPRYVAASPSLSTAAAQAR